MLENLIDKKVYEQFKFKAQHIDELAKWAFSRNCKKISQKYSNIDTTVKILNALIGDFVRKADKLEKNLLSYAKIDESKFQKVYYQKQISQCIELSQKLRLEVQERQKQTSESEAKVNSLKKELIKLKTENIKLLMKIEKIEGEDEARERNKTKELNKTMKKIFKEQQSKMIIEKTPPMPYEALMQENQRVQHQLSRKIIESKELGETVFEIFQELRAKLKKNETKSSGFGLAGSLFFKLNSSEGKKVFQKKHSHSKLLIYDVLKNKYQRVMKEKEEEKQEFDVSLEEFLDYTPMQIIGLIELKGGFEKIRWKKGVINKQNAKQQTQAMDTQQ